MISPFDEGERKFVFVSGNNVFLHATFMVAGRESAQWHFNRTPETTGRIELVT